MKTFSRFNESCVTSDVNPGNSSSLGVTNHLTPLNNIITNVRNLFGPSLSIVVVPAEDGVSLKMHSHFFVNRDEINKVLYNCIYHNLSVADYIRQQGLDSIRMINLGQYWVVYFSPTDIATAAPGLEACPCEEQLALDIDQAEIETLLTEGADNDEEMEDLTKKKLSEIITSKDKVKAAKQLELLVGQQIELPREYYFAGVKSKNGDESIALRWKYQKRAGHNETTEITKSLINIYDETEDGIFVPDFDENSMFQLPDEVRKLIENILEFLGATETKDKCVYSLKGKSDNKEDENAKDDENKDSDNSDSNDASSAEKPDENSNKKDDVKSDDTDDLLG